MFPKASFHLYSHEAQDILGVSEEKVASVGAGFISITVKASDACQQRMSQQQFSFEIYVTIREYLKKGTKTF